MNAQRRAVAQCQSQEELITSCMPLVKYFARRLVPSNAPLGYEDAVSDGYVGLVQAAQAFQPEKGISFATFASVRIRGAIIDALRKSTPTARQAQSRLREYDRARAELSLALGREPDDIEIAARLNIDRTQIDRYQNGGGVRTVPLDGVLDAAETSAGADDSAEDIAIANLEASRLRRVVVLLPEREREIIRRRYAEGDTLEDIAREIGVSTSRVCQIHKRALRRLRELMEQPGEPAVA